MSTSSVKAVLAYLWPHGGHPVVLRYSSTLLMVLLMFLLRLALDGWLHQNPFLLFALPIFLSAMLFDRWAAYLATLVSALLAGYFFMDPVQTLHGGSHKLLSLLLFVLVAGAVSAAVEKLSGAVRQLERSEAEKTVLLEELSHRAKNNLMMVSSMLSLQATAISDPHARAALESAVRRVKVVAQAQERLKASADHHGRIELCGYLESLCTSLGDMLRDVRPIAIRVTCPRLDLEEAQAVAIGLIANELVTNSLKYAFPGDSGGTIRVRAEIDDRDLRLTVQDDGVGASGASPKGLGSRIVGLLAAQHGGKVAPVVVSQGHGVAVVLPLGG